MAKMMSKKQFEEYFKDEVLPVIVQRYEKEGGIPDEVARREAWNDTVDGFIKQDLIPQSAGNWSQPKWLETLKVKRGARGNPDKPGPDNPIYVRGLGHVYIDSDDYLMLSDGRGSVGRIVSGTIKPSRDLGGAEASRLLAAFAEFGSPAKTTKRGGKKKNPSRASGRTRNSHDPTHAAREFKAAVQAAEHELLIANDNLERGKAAASIRSLVRAAYWIGESVAYKDYARGAHTLSVEDRKWLEERLQQMLDGMDNWGKNFEDAMKAK